MLTQTANRYHQQLLNNKGILNYLFGQGFTMETIKTFNIGLSLSRWDEEKLCQDPKLFSYYTKRDCWVIAGNNRAINKAKWVKPISCVKAHNVNDRSFLKLLNKGVFFYNRIMTPYYHNGEVTGFTGRYLFDIDEKLLTYSQKKDNKYLEQNPHLNNPKYKNSIKFNKKSKSEILYNSDNFNSFTVILFEGQKNVQAYAQMIKAKQLQGFIGIDSLPHAMATGGKALTIQQIQLLKDIGVDNIIMAYDGDNAGKEGVYKSYTKLISSFSSVEVLNFPTHEDMADCLKNVPLANKVFDRPYELLEWMAKYINKKPLSEIDGILNELDKELDKELIYLFDLSTISEKEEDRIFNSILRRLKGSLGGTQMKPLADNRLIKGLAGKQIKPTFNRYFIEIHEAKEGFTLKSLGFKNDKGGVYKFNKNFCSNQGEKAITTMRIKGAKRLSIFKDALDFACYYSREGKTDADVIIINSSSNIASITSIIGKYEVIAYYGKNTFTGDLNTIAINDIARLQDVKFFDMRKHYKIFKDVVEMVTNKPSRDKYRLEVAGDAYNVMVDGEFNKVVMSVKDAKKHVVELKEGGK